MSTVARVEVRLHLEPHVSQHFHDQILGQRGLHRRAVGIQDQFDRGLIHAVRDLDTANRNDREANYGALLTTDWQPKVAAGVLAG